MNHSSSPLPISPSPHLPAFILLAPQLGENIGAVARAMSNFGLTDLRIVAPRDGWPNPAAQAMAAHGEHLLEKALVVNTLKEALHDITTLYATTPRTDVLNKPVITPKEAMQNLGRMACEQGGESALSGASCDFQEKITEAKNKVGILFGPERAGLSNEDIVLADAIISIPVSEEYTSLNIAQAAVIMAYEWFILSSIPPACGGDKGGEAITNIPPLTPPLAGGINLETATKAELEGLFEHAKELLERINYFREPNKTKLMWQYLRSIWVKAGLSSQEVKTLRGLIRSINRKIK